MLVNFGLLYLVLGFRNCVIERLELDMIFWFIDKLQRVGFIGLGNMGSRMATNLIKAGYNVVVHDV